MDGTCCVKYALITFYQEISCRCPHCKVNSLTRTTNVLSCMSCLPDVDPACKLHHSSPCLSTGVGGCLCAGSRALHWVLCLSVCVQPLYRQPCEAPGYSDVVEQHRRIRPLLLQHLVKRRKDQHKLVCVCVYMCTCVRVHGAHPYSTCIHSAISLMQ